MLQTNRNLVVIAGFWLKQLNGPWHQRALSAYMIVVFGHWVEHIVQAYQVFILEWGRPAAGGVLGLWFPLLARSEVLHFVYNAALLLGMVCLWSGFRSRARTWWTVGVAMQGWHFFEHALLQLQWLAGRYLFGADQPTSILQLWIPRVELHFLYNTLVFIPMLIGLVWHTRSRRTATPVGR